jgi:hypothetical protein
MDDGFFSVKPKEEKIELPPDIPAEEISWKNIKP